MADERDDEVDEFSGFATGYDSKAMEERMKAGGQIPPGKYHARLDGAKKGESHEKQTPYWELTFNITAGPFKGSEVSDKLYITDHPRSKDRLALFGHRLGLLERNKEGGLVKVAGKKDFIDCLDVQVVIETILEPDSKDPNKKWVRLAFGGVFDPKDPNAMKPSGASKPSNEKPAATISKDDKKEPAAAASGTANKRDVRKL